MISLSNHENSLVFLLLPRIVVVIFTGFAHRIVRNIGRFDRTFRCMFQLSLLFLLL